MPETTITLPPQDAPAAAPAAPAAAPAAPAAAPAAPSFSIPESYKDKPYLKGIDSQDKLFAMLDGAQELIGKRPAGIPGEKATPEEWGKFYDAMGRPKTPAEYQFELDPSIKADEKIIAQTKEMMHRHGLTPAQAKGLQKDFDAMAIAMAKENGVAAQLQNTDFEKLATQVFGADRDKAMARGKELIEAFTPAAMKGELGKLSNEALMVLASVLNGVHAKYIRADGAPGQAPGGSAQTPDDMRAEARKLMGSDAYTNPMHPEHEKVKATINDIYRRASGGK